MGPGLDLAWTGVVSFVTDGIEEVVGGALEGIMPAMGGRAIVHEDDSLVGQDAARCSWKHSKATDCGTDGSHKKKSNRLL
jgi:hypothetical protein